MDDVRGGSGCNGDIEWEGLVEFEGQRGGAEFFGIDAYGGGHIAEKLVCVVWILGGVGGGRRKDDDGGDDATEADAGDGPDEEELKW